MRGNLPLLLAARDERSIPMPLANSISCSYPSFYLSRHQYFYPPEAFKSELFGSLPHHFHRAGSHGAPDGRHFGP
jgi:hypothetical protein